MVKNKVKVNSYSHLKNIMMGNGRAINTMERDVYMIETEE